MIHANRVPIKILDKIPLSDIEYFLWHPISNATLIKNEPLSKIYGQLNPFYQNTIGRMVSLLKKNLANQYLFIKVDNILAGQPISNCLWHLDSDLNGEHEFENVLCVFGKNTTEFITTPLVIPKAKNPVDFHSNVLKNKDFNIFKIPPNTLVQYNELNIHRAPIALITETRVLVRLQNTNTKLFPKRKTSLNYEKAN